MMIFEHVWASFAFVAIDFLPVNLFQITVLVTAITPFKYKTQSYLPKLASQSNYSQNTEYKKNPIYRYYRQIGCMIQQMP